MKFLAALFGKQKRQIRELREMEGQLHSFPDVEVIVLADVADDDRHPLPEKRSNSTVKPSQTLETTVYLSSRVSNVPVTSQF